MRWRSRAHHAQFVAGFVHRRSPGDDVLRPLEHVLINGFAFAAGSTFNSAEEGTTLRPVPACITPT